MKKLFFFGLILLLGCNSQQKDAENDTAERSSSPQAPTLADFTFTDLQGNEYPADSLKGKPVFVHFWATWCRPCIAEMPTIVEAMEQVDGINYIFPSDEKADLIKRFQERNDFPFNYVQLGSGFQEAGISTLPTTLIFDKEGNLQDAIVGAQDWNSEESIRMLRDIAAQ